MEEETVLEMGRRTMTLSPLSGRQGLLEAVLCKFLFVVASFEVYPLSNEIQGDAGVQRKPS